MQLFNNDKVFEKEDIDGFSVSFETKDPYGFWYAKIDGYKHVDELDGCFTDAASARIAVTNAIIRLKNEEISKATKAAKAKEAN